LTGEGRRAILIRVNTILPSCSPSWHKEFVMLAKRVFDVDSSKFTISVLSLAAAVDPDEAEVRIRAKKTGVRPTTVVKFRIAWDDLHRVGTPKEILHGRKRKAGLAVLNSVVTEEYGGDADQVYFKAFGEYDFVKWEGSGSDQFAVPTPNTCEAEEER
jgi:hypothetical protein